MPKKESAHQTGSSIKPKRSTRKQTNTEKKKWNGQEGGGPGRPPGKVDPEFGLTANQMKIAEKMIEAENENGFFPGSISELARSVGKDRHVVRDLLRREDFQRYLNYLLVQDGVMLELSFWRGMAIGLQAGDSKVLDLYAKMTGKIQKNAAPKLQVEIVAPDGERLALPTYSEEEMEIVDAEVIEDDDA
jgi:hypothetical protein